MKLKINEFLVPQLREIEITSYPIFGIHRTCIREESLIFARLFPESSKPWANYCAARCSPIAKLKLHLEIIRRLCHKDRPNILPNLLINQAIDYLIICDKEHWAYYKKLKNAIVLGT